MPKIYRSMRSEVVNGIEKPRVRPEVGDNGATLELKPDDYCADLTGALTCNMQGLSVAPSWRDLRPTLIPSRLQGKMPPGKKAKGSDMNSCWTMGEGDFIPLVFNENMRLYIENPTHGMLTCVTIGTPLNNLQTAIWATQNDWVKDEE